MMPGTPSRYPLALGFRKGHDTGEQGQNNEMGVTVLIMEPTLRFLQLLCENHNRDLQVGAGGCEGLGQKPYGWGAGWMGSASIGSKQALATLCLSFLQI